MIDPRFPPTEFEELPDYDWEHAWDYSEEYEQEEYWPDEEDTIIDDE